MNVAFKESFAKDLRRVTDQRVLTRVRNIIEAVERATHLTEIAGTKRLRGGSDYYRVRIGDYRVGLIVSGETVAFVRFLHRKEIYRFFP